VDEGETLGKYLRQQRESKKISLREVAKSTRVREHILKAIEEDQHHLLPPTTYVKGFLLSYAKYLGLNPKDVLLSYKKVLKGEPFTPPSTQPTKPERKVPPPRPPKPESKIPPPPFPKPKEETSPPPPKPEQETPPHRPKPEQETPPHRPSKPKQKILWNRKQTWVVGGAILASLIFFYFFSPNPSKLPIEPVPEKPPVAPSPPVTATTSVPEGKPVVDEKQPLAPSLPITAGTSVPEKKPFPLQLKAIEETWVSLQVDEQPEKEMTFKPGEGISLQASNRIRILIGNAGGLDLILDGKPLGKFGKSGEVVTLIFTSKGVEVKRPEKPKPAQE
jgi:cytoskeleton protein RodZ